MKKCVRIFVFIGFAVVLCGLLSTNTWASPFEYGSGFPWEEAVWVNVGYYGTIDGNDFTEYGDNPATGSNNVQDTRWIDECDGAGMNCFTGPETWQMGYQLTDAGFSIYSNMTLDISGYPPGVTPPSPAYIGALSGYDSDIFMYVGLTPTTQTPIGTVIPFVIQIETSGTPWANSEWEFTFNGVTVNQDNYDTFIFNLLVGEYYWANLRPGPGGFQTQSIENGFLESGFELNFVQLEPVPVPGAVWLLGSGLVGLIGLRKKHFN